MIDATTGQNGLTQAQQFTEAVEVTGVVLTKLDGSARGGIVLAIQTELGIPVKLVGLGEGAEDLIEFDADEFVEASSSEESNVGSHKPTAGGEPNGIQAARAQRSPRRRALAGFGSLMPTPPKKPGLISRIVKAPVKVAGLPFKLARGVLRLPKRLFRPDPRPTTP